MYADLMIRVNRRGAGRIQAATTKIVFVEYGFTNRIRWTVVPTHIVGAIELNRSDGPGADIGTSPLAGRGVKHGAELEIGRVHELSLSFNDGPLYRERRYRHAMSVSTITRKAEAKPFGTFMSV
jgi:hypothetical protein